MTTDPDRDDGDDTTMDALDRRFAATAADPALHPAGAHHGADDATDEGGSGAAGQGPGPYCESVQAWVAQVFTTTYPRRPTATFRWCAQWWRHPEAIARLEALWRSWEALRCDPLLGMATWYRDHLDPQLLVLTGSAGPFADCDPDRHFDPELPALPTTTAPPNWWPPSPTDQTQEQL